MEKKILFLTGKNNNTYFVDESVGLKIDYEDLYNSTFVSKVFKHIPVLTDFAIADWKRKLGEYECIICIDSIMTYEVLRWICKACNSTRIILCFRNNFHESENRWTIEQLRMLPVELWSYNIHDCEKYGFIYSGQFINEKCFCNYVERVHKYCFTFIGIDKGRADIVRKLSSEVCQYSSLRPYIYMVGTSSMNYNMCKNNKFLDYEKYLEIVSQSVAILDVVTEKNKGLTYRPLEAMFLKKKLITNYKDIVRYDFYNPCNIFVDGVDSFDRMRNFLETPFCDIPQKITDYYLSNAWVRRFFENE